MQPSEEPSDIMPTDDSGSKAALSFATLSSSKMTSVTAMQPSDDIGPVQSALSQPLAGCTKKSFVAALKLSQKEYHCLCSFGIINPLIS